MGETTQPEGFGYARPVRASAAWLLVAGCSFSTPASTGVPGDGKLADGSLGGEPGTPPAIDAMPDAAGCPANFVPVAGAGNSRYAVFAKDSQPAALLTCSNLGTHLLRLDDQAEATALEAYIDAQTAGGDTHLYRVVGARDLVLRDQFHDLDFTFLSFLPFGANEPTNGIGEECLVLKKESNIGVIGADQCLTQHEFACECD